MSNNNVLGLPPLNPNFSFGNDPMPSDSNNKLVPRADIREINTDNIRRKVIIDAHASKGQYAINRIVELDQKAFMAFYNSTQVMVEMNQEAQGKPYQKFTDAMCERMIQSMALHTQAFVHASAERIGYEVYRSPLVEGEPKGILQKIFG